MLAVQVSISKTYEHEMVSSNLEHRLQKLGFDCKVQDFFVDLD